ncbi:MAG: DUF885 domain-containing protein [Marinicaulis sp.]|nr:DUF885 domain-containing protein [Marinicaulis sp.]
MQKSFQFIINVAVCATTACAQPANDTALIAPFVDAETTEQFDNVATAYLADIEAFALPDLALSFIENLDNLGTAEKLNEEAAFFAKHETALSKIDSKKLSMCDRIDHSIMSNDIRLGAERAELGLRYLATPKRDSEPASLYAAALGEEWYRHFLARWNGAEIDPDKLFAFGEAALKKSVATYDRVIKEMGYADNAAGLAAEFASEKYHLSDEEKLSVFFAERQDIIWKNLGNLFASDYGVERATITLSNRGAEFPVPGWYERDTGTFFYNIFDETFDTRQGDWLLLHEATPGHHFQVNASLNAPKCNGRFAGQFVPAYAEGWAAYVETLSSDLGLTRTPGEKLAAIEWDMVRSVRVALDVALNAYGWSDEQAMDYWRENVRGQEDVAAREIARMKRWPAQVVTYKYGADVFGRLKDEYAGDGPSDEIRAYHDAVLTYGAMPLGVFEDLLPEMLPGGK